MAWLRRRRGIAALAVVLVGAVATAAALTPTVAPTFCTSSSCFDTLGKAEASMRNDPAYAGVGQLLEHMATLQLGPTTLRMQYWLRNRPANLVRSSSYYASYGLQGSSTGSCTTLGDDQTALPGWCADEAQVVNLGLSRIQAAWATFGCSVSSTSITNDYDPPALSGTPGTRGIVDYGVRWYKTTGPCTNGSTKSQTWSVSKRRPLYCRSGFGAISTAVSDATLTTANLCDADNKGVTYVSAPILQCAACAGSRSPVYPTTGEKQRAEPDFSFAGQTFTRYYRSIRQFRNNRSFAVAWNHTWSDRIIGGAVSAPYVHIDEIGNYEGYTFLSGSRYRGESSVDRVLERINANGGGCGCPMAKYANSI